MYRLMSNAITKKTFNCSPLTNKNISVTEMSKMMHSDCAMLLVYPAKLSLVMDNAVLFVILSGTILFVAGIPGLIGILLTAANLAIRFLFRKGMKKIDT